MSDRIAHLRAEIDLLDAAIADAVRARRALVHQIFVEKNALVLPLVDASRETEIAASYAAKMSGIDDDRVTDLVRAVLAACR